MKFILIAALGLKMDKQPKKEITIKKSQTAKDLERIPSETLAKAISDALMKDKEKSSKKRKNSERK